MNTKITPCLYIITERALAAGRALVPYEARMARPWAGPLSPVKAQRILFGFRLPHLPDFLVDHTLVGASDAERLAEVLERMVQFLANLWKWHNCGFALRFHCRPDEGVTDVALLARILARPDEAGRLVAFLAADLERLLRSFDFAPQPIVEKAALNCALLPFPAFAIVELRQREVILPLRLGDAYVVYPFWAPDGPFLLPFEVMLRQRAPTLVSLYLEPTELFQHEQTAMAEAANLARTLEDFHYDGYYWQNLRLADPQAGLVGRIYAANLRRLREPFLIAAQVASPDEATAWMVARALGTAITARRERVPVNQREAELPTGFDLIAPRTPAEQQAATRTLRCLSLIPWGPTQATEGKERLRYLADARGAAALFRFPVGVRGGVPGIATHQAAPGYEPGQRRRAAAPDELKLGEFARGGAVTIKLHDLTRHGLIAGFTGTGKTNTCLYLLDQLWREKGIPFLVIEPAKTEYRGLIEQPGFEDLLVFTLGDETTSPFRLNPFELLPGVRLETHISALKDCFNAALPQFGVLPILIEESLHAVYAEKGWRLTDKGAAGEGERLFPTLRDMYGAITRTVEQYAGELKQNLQAASAKRIGSLLHGSKGLMFNTQRSVPFDLLMTRPVVLELDALNDEEKALVMMFLLTLLREYRKTTPSGRGLQHVTLIEEAHRVMENVAAVADREIAADTRHQAVQAFCAMLAEIRAYGEGILIAEQSPEKLAPDAMRNTNLKIAHMLLRREDREAMGAAMIMDETQQEYLGKLPVGQAAVFATGFEKATFMTVPPWKDKVGFAEHLPDEVVIAHMCLFREQHQAVYLPFDGCRFCGSPCLYRDLIEPQTRHRELHHEFREALLAFDREPAPERHREHWLGIARICAKAARRAGCAGAVDAAYCYFAHEIDFPFTRYMRERFVEGFERGEASG